MLPTTVLICKTHSSMFCSWVVRTGSGTIGSWAHLHQQGVPSRWTGRPRCVSGSVWSLTQCKPQCYVVLSQRRSNHRGHWRSWYDSFGSNVPPPTSWPCMLSRTRSRRLHMREQGGGNSDRDNEQIEKRHEKQEQITLPSDLQ